MHSDDKYGNQIRVNLTMMQAQAPQRGRPRDATIDARVVAMTRKLLAEEGYTATTIQRIAEGAGVPVSAIYRRWPSRLLLVEEAATFGPPVLDAPTGDLIADLTAFVAALRLAVASPVARAAFPALLAAYQAGESGRDPEEWLRDSWRPALAAILAADVDDSRASNTVDPDDVFDVLLGTIFVQTFVPTVARRPDADRRTVAMIARLARTH